ncbi:hypothetical protein NQZ68_020941 [Dissostichus eleginoides]|nr:hypothetical protein NQZ68_020941 [Dissostichus eleginoides]
MGVVKTERSDLKIKHESSVQDLTSVMATQPHRRGGRITRKPGGPTSLSNVQEKQADSEEEDNDASGVVESTEGEGKEPSMSDLVALLQAHADGGSSGKAERDNYKTGTAF